MEGGAVKTFGAIMVAIGIIQSIPGFNEQMIGLMVTVYIAVDSFGTACNVTGDGTIALIMDRVAVKSIRAEVGFE